MRSLGFLTVQAAEGIRDDNVLYHLPISVANAKYVGSFVRLADYTDK